MEKIMNKTDKELEEIKNNYKMIACYFMQLGCNKDVARFIISQSILETGYYKSNIYKENNNLFGMKKAKIRLTTAIDEHRGHAMYINKEQCIIDYTLWLVYNGFTQKHLQNVELFKNLMANKNYCPSKDYIERITNIYNKIEQK